MELNLTFSPMLPTFETSEFRLHLIHRNLTRTVPFRRVISSVPKSAARYWLLPLGAIRRFDVHGQLQLSIAMMNIMNIIEFGLLRLHFHTSSMIAISALVHCCSIRTFRSSCCLFCTLWLSDNRFHSLLVDDSDSSQRKPQFSRYPSLKFKRYEECSRRIKAKSLYKRSENPLGQSGFGGVFEKSKQGTWE